uniref:Glutamine synthetase n=1 Tax=Pyrodinium bahamense TaxID=73915 RepID=A0A7S0AU48_9DINO
MATPQAARLAPDADLEAVAKERGIEFFFVSFVDVCGVLRSKMVPAAAIKQIQKDGAGFAPFAAWQNFGPDAPDMVAIPDASSLIQVPFQKEIGFVIGDCYVEGHRVLDSPRWVLKDQIAKAAEAGYVFKTGVEPEFFLLSGEEEPKISDQSDRQAKPCYETGALMRRYTVLKEIVQALNTCDFGVYQTDHEDANGQFEINWHYSDCLTTADRHVFFKWVVKTLAEKHGFRATFMPRPFKDKTGNGCHCHCSLWSGDRNVFAGSEPAESPAVTKMEELGLSEVGLHFLGGVLSKAATFCAITNPCVNSYKRLAGAPTASGSTWAPNRISFSGNNRTHMVRVPAGDRFEVRVADGAANPYLLPAVLLAAGLAGVQKKLGPERYFFKPTVNMYLIPDGAAEIADLPKLPQNLLDATRLLAQDAEFQEALGPVFSKSFLKIKQAEWEDFMRHLSMWELETTLDC